MQQQLRICYNFGEYCTGDRLPFLTTSTGKASTDVVPTNMSHNFVISNYASTWPLDHDDVSRSAALTVMVTVHGE